MQARLKNYFLKIFYLTMVLAMAGFTGCREPLGEVPVPQDKGRIVISIEGDTSIDGDTNAGGVANGAGARTVAPGAGDFTKYTLTFSGPELHDPVDVSGGSAQVELALGSWTITATGYTGTAGNYAAAAEGSAQVTISGGDTSPVVILLGPKTGGVQGTLSYSVTVPAGASGSIAVTTAQGVTVADGDVALTPGTNTGAKNLDPGQYLLRVRLEKNGVYAGLTEALHIYSGLTSTLPARTYTDSDFSESPHPEPPDPNLNLILSSLTGVWYSHFPGIGRLDGYRIGRWKDFDTLMGTAKLNLFPGLQRFTYTSQTGSNVPGADDFFVFYDDTVYGQDDDGTGGSEGWEMVYRYIGIVRAVNIFEDDPDRGAIIIEHLSGCAPTWDDDIKDGQRPFFGIYYKIDTGVVRLANTADLEAMDQGEKYYTETATLQEAIDKNTAENDSAFVVWSVVTPYEREQ
ncbi:MAG: hypothetical protein LBO80_07575 [Treponema sp.]|jgi:hypothetical protein|nr:hypothetical protein [Treponema sp.]